VSDLDEAIELRRATSELRLFGHSGLSASLNDLATSLLARFGQQGLSSDLDESFRFYLQLSQVSGVASHSDLGAAKS
jgi:hypothetical protein